MQEPDAEGEVLGVACSCRGGRVVRSAQLEDGALRGPQSFRFQVDRRPAVELAFRTSADDLLGQGANLAPVARGRLAGLLRTLPLGQVLRIEGPQRGRAPGYVRELALGPGRAALARLAALCAASACR